jgi:hypothetical protein
VRQEMPGPMREIFDMDPQSLRLVDHKAPDKIAKSVLDLLERRDARDAYRMRARQQITDSFSADMLFERKATWLST